ncbi:MAG: membrane protein insertase YidC [Bacteroidales bacterium]|nr:membrane protein insertase YidC [Bacteroidales bacterium]
MNRDSLIGLVLIGALFIGYFIYTQPTQEEIDAMRAKAQAEKDSIAMVDAQQLSFQNQRDSILTTETTQDTLVSDSLAHAESIAKFGLFAAASVGNEENYTIENDLIKLVVSSKGGAPESVQIKNYKSYGQKDVVLFKKDSSKFVLNFFADNKMIATDQFFFNNVEGIASVDASGAEKRLTMRLDAGNGKYIDYVYKLRPNSYLVDFDIVVNGLDQELASNRNYITLDWMIYAPQQEKGAKNENQYSQIYYKYFQDETDYLSNMSDAEEDLKSRVKWIAFKDQFFSSIFIAKDYFPNAIVKSQPVYETIPGYIKKYDASIGLNLPQTGDKIIPLQFYFGPNDYTTLRDYSEVEAGENLKLDVIVDLGWGIFGWINRFVVIPIFDTLKSFISSFGLIILLMTIIIKIFLFPLTYKSYMSTAKMKVLKPQVDEINAKIPKEKAMERQQATMALYRKAGVNPMGGCLPMVLQMPILFAMFRFFPVSIQLRQQSFLWADDLSSYDSILDLPFNIPFYGDHVSLFTLLMTASTIIYTRMQNSMNPQNTSIPGMKTMMYMMPIMFLFFLNSYASGLSYYYFVANIITFTQMYVIKRFVDEDKVLAKLEAAKKKPAKKKSGFQARLEEMAKQRQQQAKK